MYLWLKVQHILAVVTFLGSIVSGFFWHAYAARTRDAKLLAHTLSSIIRNDRVLTGPSAVLIIITGIALSIEGGLPLLGTGWILWTLALFVVGALITVLRIAPLQRQLLERALAGTGSASFNDSLYDGLARRWRVWVALAVLGPVIGVGLMVYKPAL